MSYKTSKYELSEIWPKELMHEKLKCCRGISEAKRLHPKFSKDHGESGMQFCAHHQISFLLDDI